MKKMLFALAMGAMMLAPAFAGSSNASFADGCKACACSCKCCKENCKACCGDKCGECCKDGKCGSGCCGGGCCGK
ncbi:MAG: hypothetical protein JNM85_06670 [Chthonomonas sp.]|nr:hypothetical protein [Chthonomonas sp.]